MKGFCKSLLSGLLLFLHPKDRLISEISHKNLNNCLMKMIYSTKVLIYFAAILLFSGCSVWQKNPNIEDVFYQASTINALLAGVYDGDMAFSELKQHGDFGLGTLNQLDGEMIGLDGKFYQVKTDGKAYLIADSLETPFAQVTFFTPDTTLKIKDSIGDYDQLKRYLEKMNSAKNVFYAFKIKGVFSYLKTRSVPAQRKPYPPLVDVVKHQVEFEFHNVSGTMVGFWCPAYIKGINVPGFHFHFITNDRKAGGHVLACRMQNVTLEIDPISAFYMVLPKGSAFNKTDLTQSKENEIEKVEK
jgi:acetolactate decarboxylase